MEKITEKLENFPWDEWKGKYNVQKFMECYESFKQAVKMLVIKTFSNEQSLPETLERDEQAKLWADGRENRAMLWAEIEKNREQKSNRGK